MSFEELGQVIRTQRLARCWQLQDLSDELTERGLKRGTSVGHLSAVELGSTPPSKQLCQALGDLFDCTEQLFELLRDAKVPWPTATNNTMVEVDVHCFYPIVVTEPVLPLKPSGLDLEPPDAVDRWTLYSFPFGTAVLHEIKAIHCERLQEVAQWRKLALSGCSAKVDRVLQLVCGKQTAKDPDLHYGLSAFVVQELPWSDPEQRARAVQLLATPTQLISTRREGGSLVSETGLLKSRDLLTDDLASFGVHESHIGWATWAAVSVLPIARRISIADELVRMEIELQALWAYSCQTERSGTPYSTEFGTHFLRARLRDLTKPAPRETLVTRLLRETLVRTSRIETLVGHAIEALDTARKEST